jgi:hypothetical protein
MGDPVNPKPILAFNEKLILSGTEQYFAYDAAGAIKDIRFSVNAVREYVQRYTPSGGIAAATIPLAIAELDLEKVAKAGDTMTAPLHLIASATAQPNWYSPGTMSLALQGEGGAVMYVRRYDSSSSSPYVYLTKSRGTVAAPAVLAANDLCGIIRCDGETGAGQSPVVQMFMAVVAATPSGTNMESRLRIFVNPAASITQTEVFRLDHATGLSLYGANVVVDNNRIFRLRSYTIATLPAAATAAGQMIYCSDLGGGGGQLNSDGTTWRRVSSGGQAAIATDAIFTLTPLTSAPEIKHTGTLTANRAVTLSTTNAFSGARFRITRTGGGAFTLDVGGGLKSLATNTWAEFIYDGAAWYLAAYGAL